MAWFDKFFASVNAIQYGGTNVPFERTINFQSGFTITDDPTNGRTNVSSSGGGGGGGWTINATATGNTTLSQATWQIQPINTSGGSFTLTFPAYPNAGDRIDIKDIGATSITTGIGANACPLAGNGKNIQSPHTMVFASTYGFGSPSDAGGSALSFQFLNSEWAVIG